MSTMDLRTYLHENAIDAAGFAERISVTRQAVSLWLTGSRTPRPEIMHRIVEETKGAVTPNDFYAGPIAPRSDGDAAE